MYNTLHIDYTKELPHLSQHLRLLIIPGATSRVHTLLPTFRELHHYRH